MKETFVVIISLLLFLGKLALKAIKPNVKDSKQKRQTNNKSMNFSQGLSIGIRVGGCVCVGVCVALLQIQR